MEKERVKRLIVELYNDYQKALIEAEKKGERNYNFNSLSSFITFLHNN
jgi:hypothetical protein